MNSSSGVATSVSELLYPCYLLTYLLIYLPKLKSLGVTIDSLLRFDCHAKDVARACNYHTRALRHVCSLLSDDLAQTVACSIVASRLDYCNAILYGAPANAFDVLQRERLPFRSSNDILGMEGVACVLKRDAKIFGVGVAEKGV